MDTLDARKVIQQNGMTVLSGARSPAEGDERIEIEAYGRASNPLSNG
jgi:hypothetical protein